MKLNKIKVFLLLIILIASFIRIYKINEIPPSLFGDEVDVGYQAYSILKTGRDYEGHFLPVHFHSLADFRTPLYLYASVPTVALFGISPLGVRLPAIIFGVLSIWFFYLLVNRLTKNENIALLTALFLTISPWHIQYSRAGFEATQMIFLLVSGLYFFLRGLENGKWLSLAALFLALTPWSYNTAKLYLPLMGLGLLFIWFKELKRVPKRFLGVAAAIFILVALPFAISTVSDGGTSRFNYLSIFSNPTLSPEIGFARLQDNQALGSAGKTSLSSKFFYNKFFSLGNTFSTNYLESLSSEFLFIKGDLDLRQSIGDMGEFYKFEFPFLILGIIYFALSPMGKKGKYLMLFWLLTAPIPSSITVGGGTHATRLILMLLPMTFLVAMGVYYGFISLPKVLKNPYIFGLSFIILLTFILYSHDYLVTYPWYSERWWHVGYKEIVRAAVSEGKNYNKVIISDADEPSLIYFLGWSEYPPEEFQKSLPLPKVDIPGFGNSSKLGKYYFTPQGNQQDLYEMGQLLPKDAIYLATAKEIGPNLIDHPEKMPSDLKLLKAVGLPSGHPAFYLFSKNNENSSPKK